jgi:hypothetical protein
MPKGALALSVAFRDGDFCLWALVDPDAHKVQRRFILVGTGQPIQEPALGPFVGTATDQKGNTYHMFDEGEAPNVPGA